MFLVSSNAIKQTIQLFDIVIMQKSKWPAWNRYNDHIFVNNWDRDEIISPNHMFSLSRNAIKQTIPSLYIIIMQIENGHHEITKLIIFALIIGIKTVFILPNHMFSVSRNTIKSWYFISHYYHAKFKMAAMKSLVIIYSSLIQIALILFHQISCHR